MLREARVVWPKNARGHNRLRKRFAELFGGWTETEGRGGWINDAGELEDEQVRVYNVAVRPGSRAALRNLVVEVLNASREAAAYVRYGDGEVEIINRA